MLAATGQCLAQAGLAFGDHEIIACLALAGASEPTELAGAKNYKHPFRQAIVTTDAHAACVGAHGGRDGGVIIVGTGSVGWGLRKGRHYRVGGWGFPVSDEGSGAWLGCEVIRRVLWAHDGRTAWTNLLNRVFEEFKSDPHAIVRWMGSARPRDFATLAPLVIEHASRKDAAGCELMRLAAGHIDGLAERLVALGVTRIALAGGLAMSIEPWLAPETKRRLIPAARRRADRRACISPGSRLSPQRWQSHDQHLTFVPEQPMSDIEAQMAREIKEAPDVVQRQGRDLAQPLEKLVERLKSRPPQVVVTGARGSSAHAATYGKHLIERYIGIPVAEAAPNIASVYHRQLHLEDQLFLAISQSGRSDDLVELAASAKASGALAVAIVNATDSPLAAGCDIVLPMSAGPEHSVAATKTFVATLTALQRLTALWTDDGNLLRAIARLPDRLAAATALDWSDVVSALTRANSLVTIGRGPTLAIAREASLKLKETCNLHAEAFSGAEFLHGPVALVSSRYPILMFMPTDAAAEGMWKLADNLGHKGGALFTAGHQGLGKGQLAALPPDHPETDAVCLIQSFYAMIPGLAERLGTDVDRPRHLHKVTRTR